jgi:hypothetical protein
VCETVLIIDRADTFGTHIARLLAEPHGSPCRSVVAASPKRSAPCDSARRQPQAERLRPVRATMLQNASQMFDKISYNALI